MPPPVPPPAIDAHQHYWQPARGDYDWMPKDNPTLARPWLPRDLAPDLRRAGIEATVLVQAAATVKETEYLLGIADATDSVAAVVGWVDFERPGDLAQLKRLARHPKFRGVRPMIQDIDDTGWMLRKDVQWGFRALCDLDLSLDALGFARHLGPFLTLLGNYPSLRVVIDHAMKPQIRDFRTTPALWHDWAEGMARLAERPGTFCKLSGLVTEAREDWRLDDLRPVANHVLAHFGPGRVMWGSDWPVCRKRCDYARWLASARALVAGLPPQAQARVLGATAAEFYRLEGRLEGRVAGRVAGR